jgi:hypothetical protein
MEAPKKRGSLEYGQVLAHRIGNMLLSIEPRRTTRIATTTRMVNGERNSSKDENGNSSRNNSDDEKRKYDDHGMASQTSLLGKGCRRREP